MSVDIARQLSLGLSAHLAGDLALAMRRYAEVLVANPWQSDANFLLAVAQNQTRHPDWGLFRFTVAHNIDGTTADRYSFVFPPVPPPRDYADLANESRLMGRAAAALRDTGTPVKIQFGTGCNPQPDFLNLDQRPAPPLLWSCWAHRHPDRLFAHDLDQRLPVPDDSVDFVFSEDFIEHVPQRSQVKYLAETLRILRPGAVHRISTPCLRHSMSTHSEFARGADGVWVREWDDWGHVALFTRDSLAELAAIIGYRSVTFTGKNQSTSPHRCEEIRPGSDRIGPEANIFADLVK